ncbi:hypothetical protein CBA19CS11_32160 [Caballeronia novacaledonica]|uniref:hypothetical protein n=1 Tax=Caballeronia novacaledonica TaxID=1544861 RepID=UPI001EE2C970|nr:hypothetical protein [Caballeronia novacaledonica]GJH13592.1 hypothetical protein CBA19CS11_32160 [Caballeronia novacaledonica]
MTVIPTVLFDSPQREIGPLIADRMARSLATSIVTGFLTPGGLGAIAKPIEANPLSLKTLVVGAATYPGFDALDNLLTAGVPSDRLHIHLGHTSETRGRKHPFARYHPMLHSKVYYMELEGANACAFIGSHNVTSFALEGLNGEAAVMLDGPVDSPEFQEIRKHIDAARNQSVRYSPGMKEAYAWWMREFIDGLKAEMKIPQEGSTVRTILLFASAAREDRPTIGQSIYFEIPAGIEKIESLKTETHLFLFDTLPTDPWKALIDASSAIARYTCKTLGAENKQGNREIVADWRIDGATRPILRTVPRSIFRPGKPNDMQQVRAEVVAENVVPFEYLFEREKVEWDPELLSEGILHPHRELERRIVQEDMRDGGGAREWSNVALEEALGGSRGGWKLVNGLVRRAGSAKENDEAALQRANPDSGSFILVSLRRRRHDRSRQEDEK